jgi:hypothetical protein
MDLRVVRRLAVGSSAIVGVGLGLVVALMLPLVAAAASMSKPQSFRDAPGDAGTTVVLIGQLDQAQEAAAWRLVDAGLESVDIGVESVGSMTELVLVTVSAVDGPTLTTRRALAALEVGAVQRLAVVVTDTEAQGDLEPVQLLTQETTDLLEEVGIDASGVAVLASDDADFAAQVAELLAGPPAEYAITSGAIVLVGHPGHGQDAAAARLIEAGFDDVTVGVGSVGEATELVLVTVSALDGPMPGTRRALAALDGSTIPRVAIVLTNTDALDDVELRELVKLETTELLGVYGINGPDVAVVLADDPDFVDQVALLLESPATDYVVATPPTMPPIDESATVNVEQVRGVPYPDALNILTEQGLVAIVVADPTAGVDTDCYPLVLDEFPDPDLDVPAGTTIVLTVAQPDPLLFGENCRLTEFPSEDEFNRYIGEILAQPGVTGG